MADPHHPTRGGARTIVSVLKAAAVVALIGGTVLAVEVGRSLSRSGSSDSKGVVVGIFVGTVLSAWALFFFAFALELLVGNRLPRFRIPARHRPGGDPDRTEPPHR
jgi:hypothetical protein